MQTSDALPLEDGDESGEFADALLRMGRGLEFGGYARSGLLRRVRKHVREAGFDDFESYAAYLSEDDQEHARLAAAVLVHRTEFFRDPEAWIMLQNEVLPALLAGKTHDEKLRVWCAGCATGEEAYSAAILLAQALGADAYEQRVRLFATDVSLPVVQFASRGSYSTYALQSLPVSLRDRYFKYSRRDGTWTVCSELRRQLIFGRQDLLRDPHLGQMDLILCRNTLMYFTPAARKRVLAALSRDLRACGVLFTGSTEIPNASVDLFTRSCSGQPFYRKVADADRRALATLLRSMFERRRAERLTTLVP